MDKANEVIDDDAEHIQDNLSETIKDIDKINYSYVLPVVRGKVKK